MHSHSRGAAGAGSRERGQPVRGLLFVSAVVFMGFLSVGLFSQLLRSYNLHYVSVTVNIRAFFFCRIGSKEARR